MIIAPKSMKNPDKVNLDKNQADALVARLESNSLTDFDRTILKFVLEWYLWLQSALQESKISISRIKAMFGFKKTESSKNLESELNESSDDDTDEDILALLSVEAKDSSEATPESAPITESSNQNSFFLFYDNNFWHCPIDKIIKNLMRIGLSSKYEIHPRVFDCLTNRLTRVNIIP